MSMITSTEVEHSDCNERLLIINNISAQMYLYADAYDKHIAQNAITLQ